MKKIISAVITTTLASVSINTSAAVVDFNLQFLGADFVYDPNQVYNNIGTESDKSLFDTTDDGFSDNTGEISLGGQGIDMTFATLRDAGLNDAFEGPNDMQLGAGDGKADNVFADNNYADKLNAILVTIDGEQQIYMNQPLYIDFRFVLGDENDLSNKVKINGANTYGIIEEYSFIDILTQEGDLDWGLGLDVDSMENATIVVKDGNGTDGSSALQLSTTISGKVFNDQANNLPWLTVSNEDTIRFTLDFQTNGTSPNWNQTVEGTGTGSVTGKAVINEPMTASIFGLALAGMGIMQRRRKKLAE